MLIKNKKTISLSKNRKTVFSLLESGIKEVLPKNTIKNNLVFDVSSRMIKIGKNKFRVKGRIFVVGGGKSTGAMAEVLERIIPSKFITDGIVNCTTTNYKTKKIKINKASHPLPNLSGVTGTKKMLELKEKYKINKDDLVLCLISGGGSALMVLPVDGISLFDKVKLTRLLLATGANIHEINTIRKHISKVKGGQLAEHLYPAHVVSLIISDVIGNNLDIIASGSTVADPTTYKDAINILKKYKLINKAPKSVIKHLSKGYKKEIKETPKKLNNARNYIIGDIKIALEAMEAKAKKMGLRPLVVDSAQIGDPSKVAKKFAKEIISGVHDKYNVLLLGGETTPVLPKNPGKGGRNQHYTAVLLKVLKNLKGKWALVSLGTDGSDFLPNVAGAIIDNNSYAKAESKKIDIGRYIKKYDSYNLFKRLGGSIIETGNTGTNVCDLVVFIKN